MDNDIFSIIIYIVIIALGGLLSAYRSKEKRKQSAKPGNIPQPTSPGEGRTTKRFDPFEELFSQLDVEEEPMPAYPHEPQLADETDTASVTDTRSMEESAITIHEEGIPVFKETAETMISTDHMETDSIASSQIGDVISEAETDTDCQGFVFDDPVKAIIYSEILKRQQF